MYKDKFSVSNFPNNGFCKSKTKLNKNSCLELRKLIDKKRPITKKIFYSTEKEFSEKGRYKNYAPGVGHNFLESCDLDFIENDEGFRNFCGSVIGKDFQILKKSVIRSTPVKFVPQWIRKKVANIGRPNLNPYVRDEYQDVQFFLCTDFHQDKTRQESEFITVYIYLDDVEKKNSALQILLGSHHLGFTSYPHNLRQSDFDSSLWFYNDAFGNFKECNEVTVTGKSGTFSCFHNLTLHGTGYNNEINPRISLRYLIGNKSPGNTIYSLANEKIFGKKINKKSRFDVDSDGILIPLGSSLNFLK